MKVAVLGPGGVGGFLAGALARAGDEVVVVAREPTAAAIARDGVRVRSVRLGEFTARPRAVARLEEEVDVLVVAPKAPALEAALARVAAVPRLVVPLLNGLDHVAWLRERFGSDAVAAAIRIEARRVAPGEVVHTSPFLRVDAASDDPGRRPRVEAFVHALRAAEVPAEVGASEADVLWGKLVRLNAIACTTTAYDAPMGAIRDRADRRADLADAVTEGGAVARAEGAAVEDDRVLAELWAVHPELRSSMSRDVAAGREPELDAIPGAVLRAAARHDLPCPTIERLVGLIEARLARAP